MTKNINTKANETTKPAESKRIVTTVQVRRAVEDYLQTNYGNEAYSTEELDILLEDCSSNFQANALADHIADRTARRTLGAVKRRDWWVDKAVGGMVQGVVSGAVLATGYTVLTMARDKKLFKGVGNTLFSNTEPAVTNPRSLRGTRRESHLQSTDSVA